MSEASAELLARQSALQREAEEVIREFAIEASLGQLGRAVAIGSVVTGLMVWRDLDFIADTPGLTTGRAFEALHPLLERSRALHYENDGELRRHYFVLRIPWRDHEWKLDLSLFLAGIPAGVEDFQNELRERLTDELRLTILVLKDAWYQEPAYPEPVGGFEIYDAVLNGGVRSRDQLDEYLLERGLPARTR